MAEAEVKANKDQAEAMNRFRRWATKKVPGAEHMNVGSGTQIRQLLFAGVENQKPEKGVLEQEKVFKVCLLVADLLQLAWSWRHTCIQEAAVLPGRCLWQPLRPKKATIVS